MNNQIFNELIECVKQAGAIRKGKASGYTVIQEPDVAAILSEKTCKVLKDLTRRPMARNPID